MTGLNDKDTLDLDLLAYADGRLDDDAPALARIEARLAAVPELAARMRAYRAQTTALREAYDGRAEEAVPEHLVAVLDGRRAGAPRRLYAAAAVMLLTLAAGAAGWAIGRGEAPRDTQPQAFMDGSFQDMLAAPGTIAMRDTAAEPLDWLSGKIALTLHAPDLSELGYVITDKRAVSDGTREMVRLTYGNGEGKTVSLFLRPRWSEHDEGVTVSTVDGLSVARWRDGPLSSAIAADLPATETAAIAERVRAALRDPAVVRPAVEPDIRPVRDSGPAVADGPVPQAPEGTAPDVPAPILPDLSSSQTMTN